MRLNSGALTESGQAVIWPDTLGVSRSPMCCLQPAASTWLDAGPWKTHRKQKWTRAQSLRAPWHLSCNTFLGQLLFYPEGFVVWSPSRGLHKQILFPCTLLESLGWCWSQCHADLLFSFAGMFSVWILYCFWHPGIWLGNPLDFGSVYLLSCQSYGVAQCRCEPLDSCVNLTMVFHKGRQTFISLTSLKATETHCRFKCGIHYGGLSHENVEPERLKNISAKGNTAEKSCLLCIYLKMK